MCITSSRHARERRRTGRVEGLTSELLLFEKEDVSIWALPAAASRPSAGTRNAFEAAPSAGGLGVA